MTLRFQRLLLILFTVTLLMGALLLILYNSKQNIVFFYTPSELIESNHNLNEKISSGRKNYNNHYNNTYIFIYGQTPTKIEIRLLQKNKQIKVVLIFIFPEKQTGVLLMVWVLLSMGVV